MPLNYRPHGTQREREREQRGAPPVIINNTSPKHQEIRTLKDEIKKLKDNDTKRKECLKANAKCGISEAIF